MKKLRCTSLLLALIFAASAFACSSGGIFSAKNEKVSSTDAPLAAPTGHTSTAAPSTSAPYEPGMTWHEVYDPNTDFDNRFGRGDIGVVETEEAYYFQPIDPAGGYLYYYDKLCDDCGVLCPRPECMHTDDSCNARLHARAGTLSILLSNPDCSGINVGSDNRIRSVKFSGPGGFSRIQPEFFAAFFPFFGGETAL